MTEKSNFDTYTEEEKIQRAYSYALMHCQNYLLSPHSREPALEQYTNEIKSIVDWLSKKMNLEGVRLY